MKNPTFQQIFTRHLILGITAINVIVYAIAAFHLYQSRQFYENQTEISTQNLARTLETNISGILNKLNVALFAVTREAERQIATGQLDAKALNDFMATQLRVVPEFEGIWITDQHGLVRFGTQMPAGGPVHVTDREYFIRQSRHPDLGMVISKLAMGRIIPEWTVVFSRRINHPDGSFGGIAGGSIAVDKYFSRMFATLDVGAHGLISLRDDELASVARMPPAVDERGQIGSIYVSRETVAMVRVHPLTATYAVRTKIDGIVRTMTYRKVNQYPWYVFVGQSALDYLSPWRRQAAILLSLLIPFSLVSLFSVRLVLRRTAEAFASKQMEARNEILEQRLIERRQAEAALAKSEERLAASASLAGLGYYEVDYGAQSCFADPRFGEICGVPPGAQPDLQQHQFWFEHLHPDDRQRVEDERQAVFAGKAEYYNLEYRYLHPTEGQKWVHHLSRVAARDATGRVIRVYGVVRDITERRRTEAELQRLRLDLWHADRVAQTGAITASLAHELNQPLAAILSNAQAGLRFMSGENPDLGEVSDILADIVDADKRAGAIISGLRSMLRRKETGRERVNLAGTIEEVALLVHSELVGQQIELRSEFEPDVVVLADRGQLQQVILNLVMNAVQAMQDQPTRQRRLELTLVRTNAGEARVSVRDTGPGIAEAQQRKLFEAFWTTKHQGLGIGLHIARSIVEAHGGHLSFANNPDRGATFSFTLPLAAKEDASRPPGFSRHEVPT